MFTPEELKPGAKRVVIEYIASQGIPTARVLTEKEALELERFELSRYRRADLIVRADDASQWDGFSGVFGSYKLIGDTLRIRGLSPGESHTPDIFSLEELIALASLNNTSNAKNDRNRKLLQHNINAVREKINWYTSSLKKEPPERLEVLIQEAHSGSNSLFQHPSNEDLVVISMNNRAVLYDRQQDSFRYLLSQFDLEYGFQISKGTEDFFRQAVKTYDAVAALPKFSGDYTFEMEFGKDKKDGHLLVYQVRLFRKKETADFTLTHESGENIINFELSLGITTKNGVDLAYQSKALYHQYWFPDTPLPDVSNSIVLVGPSSDDDSVYPHVACPGIRAIMYPVFQYTHNHGARESLMKVPLLQLGISNSKEVSSVTEGNITMIDYTLASKIQHTFNDGQVLKVFSDGRKSRIQIIK